MIEDDTLPSKSEGSIFILRKMARYVRLFVFVFRIFYRHPILFLLLLISFTLGTLTALYEEQNKLFSFKIPVDREAIRRVRTYDKFVEKIRRQQASQGIACSLPNIDPFHESIMINMKKYGELHCPGPLYSNLYSSGNILRVQGENISRITLSSIGRPPRSDFHFELGNTQVLLRPRVENGRSLEPGIQYYRLLL